MKYLEEAIDIKSPYAKKYLKLVSRPDTGDRTEDHHIVPVAYFSDVLKVKTVRKASSPDMDRDNIVALTPGHHLLAHYYLYKCARKCIRPQMASAVSMMFSLKDIDKRISQLTEKQAREIASARDEAKAFSGWKTRRLSTGFISKILYKDGKEVYGFLLHPNGNVRQFRDRMCGFGTDEYDGAVHAWDTYSHNTIATTSFPMWNRTKVRYDSIGVATPNLNPLSSRGKIYAATVGMNIKVACSCLLAFRGIVEKFYPSYKNNFDESWEQLDKRFKQVFPGINSWEQMEAYYREQFPGIKPYRIPDVPTVV